MDTQNNQEVVQPVVVDATKAPNHSTEKVIMGILSYLGILVVIPFLVKKDDPFVKFHIKQGLVILCIEIAMWVLSYLLYLWAFGPIFRIINLALFVLSIIGIVNVVGYKQKELPVVGKFGEWFKI